MALRPHASNLMGNLRSLARLLLALLFATAVASAQSTWTGAVDSDWSNPANWSGPVPDAAIDATIPTGTASAPFLNAGAAHDVRSLTVQLGASLTIESGAVVSIFGSLNAAGSVSGGGKIEFIGSQAATWSGSGSVPSVVVSKVGAGLDVLSFTTIRGTLSLTGGQLRISTGSSATLVVQGNATFSAGTLVVSTNGTLDVNGDVTFAGTSVTGTNATRIWCAGNWTGHSAFAPTSGEVLLDGTSQTLSGTCNFAGLRVAANSSVVGGLTSLRLGATIEVGATLQLTSANTIQGDFSVLGTLITSGVVMDVDGGLDVRGSWVRGSESATIGRGLSGSGSVTGTGTITFDGSSSASLGTFQNLSTVRIVRTGTAEFGIGPSTIFGNLEVVSGTVRFEGPSVQSTTVNGNVLFSGGVLIAGGTIDANGDVIFSGTQCVGSSPNVRCAGTWTAHPAYAPTLGTITFDGGVQQIVGACTLPQVVLPAGTTLTTVGAATFRSLEVQAGAQLTTTAALTITSSVLVTGILDSSGGPASVAFQATVQGSWNTGGSTLRLGGGLEGSGTLVPGSLLVFDSASSGSVNFTGALPSVRIEKATSGLLTAINMTVNGDLAFVSGRFLIQDARVNGNAYLQGGAIETNGLLGNIDVNGDVVQSGTTLTFRGLVVRCAGNWVGHPAYAPPSGLTILDGPSSTISGTPRFYDLSIPAGTNATATAPFTVVNQLSLGGTLTTNGADIDSHVAIEIGGSWDVGSVGATVGGGITGPGSILGTGTITMDGSVTGQIGTIGRVPPLRIAKATNVIVGLNGNALVDGDLEVVGGILRIGTTAGSVLTVNGNGRFLGGRLSTVAVCTLDLNGDATFAGTTTTTTMPTIRCSGNWVGDSAFAPTAGTVVFDGVHQTISGNPIFASVTIEAGSIVHASAGASFRQQLVVNGTLRSNGLAATGGVLVNQGGSWVVDPGSTTISLSLSGAGSVTGPGTLTFDGSAAASLGAFQGLPSIRIAKTSGANFDLLGTSSVTGSFELASGTLRAGTAANQSLDVSGNARFLGGTLAAPVPGLLVVGGDVQFQGAACAATPAIRCAGNWISDSGYAPTSGGGLAFDGTSSSTIEVVSPSRQLRAPGGIAVSGARRTVVGDLDLETPSLVVAAGGSLASAGGVLNLHAIAAATAVAVDGDLELQAGSRLQMGPSTTCTIGATGTLRLLGTPSLRATVEGDPVAGGGYDLSVHGLVAARNFTVRQPGANGFVLAATASIASAPDDLRAGRFDLPMAVPGAALLTIARAQPTRIHYADFANSSAVVGAFNVRCLAGGGVDLVNWTGAFAGSAFEDDPNGLVQWLPPVQTNLVSFVAQAGSEKVGLEWRVGSVEDAEAFVLECSDGGPFAVVAVLTVDGGAIYQFVDQPRVAGTTYQYRLNQRLTHGEVALLGTASATPFAAAAPANVLSVGPTGTHATPQAAIDAAVLAGSVDVVVRLSPGVHPPFVIDAPTVQSFQLVGDGVGVAIDTATGPVVVRHVPANCAVVLSDLAIGSPLSSGAGLHVQNCVGLVVLDECTVQVGAASPSAMDVTASGACVVQRCTIDPALRIDLGAFAAVSASTVGTLIVNGSSYVQTCGVAVSAQQVGVGSTHEALAGTMPEVRVDDLAALGMPLSFEFVAEPFQLFAIAVDALPGFAVAPGSTIEMPLLLAFQASQVIVLSVTDANGEGGASPLLPNLPAYLGQHLFVQGARIGASTIRLSNLEMVTIVP